MPKRPAMTTSLPVRVTFHGYWHCGAGAAAVGDLDAVAIRSEEGLPFVPGRTLKGVFREAVSLLEENGLVAGGAAKALFGEQGFAFDEDGAWTPTGPTQAGCLAFSDCRLDATIRAWFANALAQELHAAAAHAAAMFDVVARTAIDAETGTAADGSLRLIECAVPLSLEGTVDWAPDPYGDAATAADWQGRWRDALTQAAILVRGIGADRTRGLGRCTVKVGA
mgnify:CR=1 FL=1